MMNKTSMGKSFHRGVIGKSQILSLGSPEELQPVKIDSKPTHHKSGSFNGADATSARAAEFRSTSQLVQVLPLNPSSTFIY